MGIANAFFNSPAGLAIGRLIHARVLASQDRSQSLATSLFRNVRQLSAFEGPLADLVRAPQMRVLIAGCSIGCEAYTLAGYLTARHPELEVAIEAFDIDASAVAHAESGRYAAQYVNEAVFDGPFADVAQALIIRDGDGWLIRPEVASLVTFSVGDALTPRPADAAAFDVVLAQNFMVHMDDAMATRALETMAACLRPGGAMFIGGMTLGMRPAATGRAGLAPVDWNIREIHDEDAVRRNAWPFAYWSLEPFDGARSDWRERYGTIFRNTG